jgi:hypothetical protein
MREAANFHGFLGAASRHVRLWLCPLQALVGVLRGSSRASPCPQLPTYADPDSCSQTPTKERNSPGTNPTFSPMLGQIALTEMPKPTGRNAIRPLLTLLIPPRLRL